MYPDRFTEEEPNEKTAGAARSSPSDEFLVERDRLRMIEDEDENEGEVVDEDEDEDEDEDVDDEEAEETEEESLAAAIEEEPRTVLITGASGNIGRKLRAAWADVYDLVLIDKNPTEDDHDVIKADLGVLDDDWITHFHGVDAVVHLAANSDEFAGWDDLIEPNLDALANVFHVSALAGVERIVFASSNHVMGQHEHLGDEPIGTDTKPLPDGPYAVTKLVGERLGRSFARAFDVSFIALRLGWIQAGQTAPKLCRTIGHARCGFPTPT